MKRALWLGLFGIGGVVAIIACGKDDDTTIASPDAGTPDGSAVITQPATDSGDVTTNPDSGDDDDDSDASAIDDGGANIDPDAGDDDDAGDAAPCNTVTNDATSILSICDSQIPGLTGGALVAGTYHLTQVAALGSATFCQTQFVPTRIAETLVLGADGTAQLVTTIGNSQKSKANTLVLVPGAANTSPLEQTQTCPVKPEEKTIYESVLRNQKQILIIEENYGTGRGLYRYEKQ